MSTFLQLCQKVAREVGKAGVGPSTTINQTGEAGDIVRWVSDSYVEIQNRHNAHWRWLRHDFTLNVLASNDTYNFTKVLDDQDEAFITRFSSWILTDRDNPPRIFPANGTISQQYWMIYADWSWFKSVYRIGGQNAGKPVHMTLNPRDEIVLGPPPRPSLRFTAGTAAFIIGEIVTGTTSSSSATISGVTLESGTWGVDAVGVLEIGDVTGSGFEIEALTGDIAGAATSSPSEIINGEYWQSAQILAEDADVPEMPSQFHDLIVWWAVENYGYFEAADEVIQRAQIKLKTYMRQLEHNQLARWRKHRPLV